MIASAPQPVVDTVGGEICFADLTVETSRSLVLALAASPHPGGRAVHAA
jgi:hypothetical protein